MGFSPKEKNKTKKDWAKPNNKNLPKDQFDQQKREGPNLKKGTNRRQEPEMRKGQEPEIHLMIPVQQALFFLP